MTKKKYVFTNETMVFHHGFPEEKSSVLRRIQAVVDIPLYGVKAGDLGGFIESEANLSHSGKAWIGGDALVFDEAVVIGNAFVGGNSMVKRSCITGKVVVSGSSFIEGSILKGKFTIDGKVEIRDAVWTLRNGLVTGTEYSDSLFHSKMKQRNVQINDFGVGFTPARSKLEEVWKFLTSTPFIVKQPQR